MSYFYLKMHQNAFGGRPLPGPAGGAYSAPSDPLAGLKGKGSEGGSGREEKGGERKGEGPPNAWSRLTPLRVVHKLKLKILNLICTDNLESGMFMQKPVLLIPLVLLSPAEHVSGA